MRKLYTILCVLALTGCSGFLEEYSQDKAYVKGWEDLDELMLGNAYFNPVRIVGGWWSQGTDGVFYYPWIHVLADELQQITDESNFGQNYAAFALYGYHTWQLRVYEDPAGQRTWDDGADFNKLYAHINACNIILHEIAPYEASATEENDVQNIRRIKGECHFLRAANYFMLVNFYGKPYEATTAAQDPAVPLKLSHYVEDLDYRRNSVAEIYNQILEDLQEAENLLKDVERKSQWRADINSVRLLMSRVYLYMCDYANTQKYAAMVIENGPRLENLNGFSGESFLTPELSELIFSMGSTSIFGSVSLDKESSQGANEFRISDELYAAYDAVGGHDLRLQHYVTRKEGTLRYKKLQGDTYSTPEMSDIFIMRTSEAYLNLAEAAVCGDNETAAREALKTLRRNRIETAYAAEDADKIDALGGKELMDFIRQERQRELCMEGHRWFDLRRYRVAAKYAQPVNLVRVMMNREEGRMTWHRRFTLTSDDPAWVLPLPKEEIDKNAGMIDNPRDERSYETL